MSLIYDPDVFDERAPAPPLWRDAVVGASVAAIAAAAGLGTHVEAGAAPWLSIVAGLTTAAALWGAHRQLGGGAQGRRTAPSGRTASDRNAPVRKQPTAASPVAKGTATSAPSVVAPNAPTPSRSAASPELSTFARRPTAPPANVLPTMPPRHGPVVGPAKVDAASHIDPEAQFLHLQGLVRQLAAEVPGARAPTADPDRSPQGSPRIDPTLKAGTASAAAEVVPQATEPQSRTPLARLAEAVAAERFDMMLEPIQAIAEARARHFELSVRFRDEAGEVLPAEDVARIARNTGLATSIDVLKLPRVAKVVQRVQGRGGAPADVLTLLAGSSLSDHLFMEAFAGAFPTGVPGALILSFAQADVRAFARVHWGALNALSDMGLRFALADVSDLDMDFEMLRARSFVFAKLDANVFLDGLPSAGGGVIPSADVCAHLKGAGLDVIVSGIDTEAQLGRIAPYRIGLGQGRLFGTARPVKPEVMR